MKKQIFKTNVCKWTFPFFWVFFLSHHYPKYLYECLCVRAVFSHDSLFCCFEEGDVLWVFLVLNFFFFFNLPSRSREMTIKVM